MNGNKNVVIWCLVLLVLAVIVFLTPRREHYDWSYYKLEQDAGQPYAVDLVDEMLERSLPNGYEVRQINSEPGEFTSDSESKKNLLKCIKEASIDTALFVAQRYYWRHDSGYSANNVILPEWNLLEFAFRGGTALFIDEGHEFAKYGQLLSFLYADRAIIREPSASLDYGGYYRIGSYSKEFFKGLASWPFDIINGDDTIHADLKFLHAHFKIDNNHLEYYNDYYRYNNINLGDYYGPIQITPMLMRRSHYEEDLYHMPDPDGLEYCEPTDKESIIRAYPTKAYMLDIYFPKSGGHLYVSTLNLMATNLGLTVPGGPELLAGMMSCIDDKPVARLEYKYHPKVTRSGSGRTEPLSVLSTNPALSFAWVLILAFFLCLLVGGLMRRYPAVKGIEAEEVDKTDLVAEREHRFRRSPLLHFLFQTSWLYNSNTDYRDLFEVNFRSLARLVSRHTNVELVSATAAQLDSVAEYFSNLLSIDRAELLDDLQWMKKIHDNEHGFLNHKHFSYSQAIIEKFNRV